MSTNIGKKLVGLINEENIAGAKKLIGEALDAKLAEALNEKFEEFASTIFEGKKPAKKDKGKRWQDSDGDGKWYEPGDDVKAVNENAYCEDGECEDEEDMPKKKKGKKHKKEEDEEEKMQEDGNGEEHEEEKMQEDGNGEEEEEYE